MTTTPEAFREEFTDVPRRETDERAPDAAELANESLRWWPAWAVAARIDRPEPDVEDGRLF